MKNPNEMRHIMKIDKGSFINDFIDKNLRQYTIPVYQRDYEWAAEECEKLFEDIIQAYKSDRYHFTGSVVYELLKTENKIDYYIIIDGQQRLTTIYILIKSLIDVAETEREKEALIQLLYNNDKFQKYNIDEASKLKLKPIKSDNQQLLLLMEGKKDKMDKSCGIYQNYIVFCKLIQKALERDPDLNIEKIYDGIQHLSCAMIKLEEEEVGKEQEIFERINSTGKPLSLADKIRNFVLMTEVDQERLYEEYWLQMEELLTKEHMPSFFYDYLNIKVDGFTREKDAYDRFKINYEESKYTNEEILKELLHYAKQYNIFLNGDKSIGEEANKALEGLRNLKQSTVYLFLFSVFDDFEEGIIDTYILGKVLNLLLSYSIRRLTCEVGSNSLRGLYKTMYHRVFNRAENRDYYYDSIASFLLQLTTKDAMPSDEYFSIALRDNNLYRKNALCKYLLTEIENQGKEKVVIDTLSIEHIMPQNKNLSRGWRMMLGENWRVIHEKYLHTIGNLTLTGYNSELGDKPFEDKKELLQHPETHTHITILYKDVLDQKEWTESTITRRAEVLTQTIMNLFKIQYPEREVDFSDPRFNEYKVTDPQNATYKIVNYYELFGERVNIDTFAGMIRSVAEKLYEMDNSVIHHMAKNNEAFPNWQNHVFSYDENTIRRCVALENSSGIFIATGFSAYDCIAFIRALMKKYDLDIEEDFVYSARPSKSDE